MGQAKPTDFGDLKYNNASHNNLEKDDGRETDKGSVKDSYGGNVYDTGIFTKYPENPTADGYNGATISRQRRNTSENCSDNENDALDVNQLFFDKVYNVSRPIRKSDEKNVNIPLNGLISAIETELVDSAEKINSEVSIREGRSAETTTIQSGTEKPDENDDDDSIDVNKNFFDEIFEFTRAQRETTKENVANKTIKLDGLIQAVESTLVKSAQKLQKSAATKKNSGENADKTAIDTEAKERRARSVAEEVEEKSHIGVKKLSPSKNINLDLLSPITFKAPINESSESLESNETDEVPSTTHAMNVQPTNLIVLHDSNSTHIIANADKKTMHVQHQQISQTIFQSTLAILPTISPNNINVPSFATVTTTTTTTIQPSQTDAVADTVVDSSTPMQVSDETKKLKEKVAEVEATPIILSQGI